MAKCRACGQEMKNHVSCTKNEEVEMDVGGHYKTIPYPESEKNDCHDCGCPPGGHHHPGCDMERCPACGGKLISCGCLEGTGPSDSKRRAFEATETLEVYQGIKSRARTRAVKPDTKVEPWPDESDLGDCIADILHLAVHSNMNPVDIIRSAVFHLVSETKPNEELSQLNGYLHQL